MQQYHEALETILSRGTVRPNRTGTDTIGVFGLQSRYSLSEGFPLVTTKKMFMRGIVIELLWFLAGSTNIKPLVDANVNIWNAWPFRHYNSRHPDDLTEAEFVSAIKNNPEFAALWGELGPVYGSQWRHWKTPRTRDIVLNSINERVDGIASNTREGYAVEIEYEYIDQIEQLLAGLRSDPYGRRHIVSAWNPAEIEEMKVSGLPPCHCLFQMNVRKNDKGPCFLDCLLLQRSCDFFLGVPFNIASYALLTHMVAQQVGMIPGDFVHTYGDAHIYVNHIDAVKLQLSREPLKLPKLHLSKAKDIFSYKPSDVVISDYNHHPAISGQIAV